MHFNISTFSTLQLPRIVIAVLAVVLVSLPMRAQLSTAKPTIKEYKLTSRILNQERKITIYKPPVKPKYKDAISPVIYVLDGEHAVFYYCTLVNYLCERTDELPPITVVGIENEPGMISERGEIVTNGRDRDFIPLVARDSSRYKYSGGADKFLQFINEEVFPFVEKEYPKPPYRVFAGGSLAGWLVLHAFLKHAGMFNGYIALSPAMYLDNSAYMKIVEETINEATERNNRLFFSVGNEPGAYIPNATKTDSLLKNKNLKGLSYQFVYYSKEGHASLKANQDGFQYIFQIESPRYSGPLSGLTYHFFENYFNNLSKIYGYAMKPWEGLINDYGYIFLNQEKDLDKALEFFKKNTENYPGSPNVYDSYAEALLAKGDKENALINYEKAYQMDPTNTYARDIIVKLRKEK